MAFDPNSASLVDDIGAPSPKAFDPMSAVEAPAPEKPGLFGTLAEGAKSTARAVGSAVDVLTGNNAGVVEKSQAQAAAPRAESLDAFYKAVDTRKQAMPENPGVLDAIKSVGGAVLEQPAGAALALVEQTPNAVPSLGGALAGAKAGAAIGSRFGGAGAAIGGLVGAAGGMFAGNAALETGFKGMDAARDGSLTDAERSQVLREGATKGAVITGVDLATLGASKWIMGASSRAVEAATRRALTDAGVNVADRAAVETASQIPEIAVRVSTAQNAALEAANKLGQRAMRGGAAIGLETAGEGVGEYLGELAATGKADMVDAALESIMSLGHSGAEVAWGAMQNRKGEQASVQGGALSAAPPPQPAFDPNAGPMSRAANKAVEQSAAAPASGIEAALSAADAGAAAPEVSPFDQRLSAAQSFVDDKAFIQALRGTEGFGPESVTEVLSAFAKARNPNVDPIMRERAMSDLEGFINTFNSRPNFVFGQRAQQPQQDATAPGTDIVPAQGGAVSPFSGQGPFGQGPFDDGMTMDGEFRTPAARMAGATTAERGLPTAESLQAKRNADAAYEQAFQDLVKADQLGASDAAILADQRRREQRRRDALRAEIETADADTRNLDARERASATSRLSVLESVLADPETRNPATRFVSELRRQGYADIRPTKREQAVIKRYQDVVSALDAADAAANAVEPAAPNELDAAAMGIRERQPKAQPTPPKPPARLFPFANREAAQRQADKMSAAEGRPYVVGDHPVRAGAFAAMPAADVQQGTANAQNIQAPAAPNLQGVTQPAAQNAPAAGGVVSAQAQNPASAQQGGVTNGLPKVEQIPQEGQAQGGQEGEKAFPVETGTLGIPRAEMPQVPAKSHGGLVRHLNAQGIAHETTNVDAASLKPTQDGYSPEKVEAAKTASGDRAVIVSSDGHIVDGHHQALAAAEEGKPVKAIVLDAPIGEALEAVKNSPSASPNAAPAQTTRQSRPTNRLQLVRNAGGVSMNRLADVTGDSNPRRAGAVGVFTKNGMDLDGLAELLQQNGFMTEADVNDTTSGAEQAADLLRKALSGERVLSLNDVDAELAKDEERKYRDRIRQRASEIGVRTTARKFDDVEADVLRYEEQAAFSPEDRSAYALDFAGIESMPQVVRQYAELADALFDENAGMSGTAAERLLGFTEDEINAENRKAEAGAGNAQADDARAAGAGAGAATPVAQDQGQGQGGGESLLSGYTNADIAQRESEQRAQQEAEQRAEREAIERDRKAREQAEIRARSAAAADTFELGMDPMANLTGQGDIFSQPAQSAAQKQEAQPTPETRAPQYAAGDRVVTERDVMEGDIVTTPDGKQWMAKVKRGRSIPVVPFENGRPVVSAETARRFDLDETEVTHTGTNVYGYGGQAKPSEQQSKPESADTAIAKVKTRLGDKPSSTRTKPATAEVGESTEQVWNRVEMTLSHAEWNALQKASNSRTSGDKAKLNIALERVEDKVDDKLVITSERWSPASVRASVTRQRWEWAEQNPTRQVWTFNADALVEEISGAPFEPTQGQKDAIAKFKSYEADGSGKVAGLFLMDGDLYLIAERNGEQKVARLPKEGNFVPASNALMGFGFRERRRNLIQQSEYAAKQAAEALRAEEGRKASEDAARAKVYEMVGGSHTGMRYVKQNGEWHRVLDGKLHKLGRRRGDDSLLQVLEQQERFGDLIYIGNFGETEKQDRAIAAYNAPQAVELDLRAKSHEIERGGDVGVVMGNGGVRFVTLQEAADAVRGEIARGTDATPFQIHNVTGIRIGDAQRAIDAAQAADPTQPDERAIESELDKVPENVRKRVAVSLRGLRDAYDRLANVKRARGEGQILTLEVRDAQAEIAKRREMLETFRTFAGNNGVDADLVIRGLGGEPDFAEFGAPAMPTEQDLIDKAAQPDVQATNNDANRAKWNAMSRAERDAMLTNYMGRDSDAAERYGSRPWNSFNVGERDTLAMLMRNRREAATTQAAEPAQADDRITADQARTLMMWEDRGQRDNVRSMNLLFFENTEDMKAGRGGMVYGTIESYQGGQWNIGGTNYPSLKAAKADAVEQAIERLRGDGYVAEDADPASPTKDDGFAYAFRAPQNGKPVLVPNKASADSIANSKQLKGRATPRKLTASELRNGDFHLTGFADGEPVKMGYVIDVDVPERQDAAPPDDGRNTFTVERVEDNQRNALTFRRGEAVKVAGSHPMESGQIEGISQYNRQFKVGGVWYDFGYAYKSDYDEFAAPRREMDQYIAAARQRIDEGRGFSRTEGYPIREARAHAARYALTGYDNTLNELEQEGQRAFDEHVATLRAEQQAREQADSERRQAERIAAAQSEDNAPIQMTMDEWKRIGKDFKSFNGGSRTAMIGGRIRAVEIVKPAETNDAKQEAPADATPADAALDTDASTLEGFRAVDTGLRDGTITLDQYKAAFASFMANKASMIADLNKLKKDEALALVDGFMVQRLKSAKKDEIVNEVWSAMRANFALGRSFGPQSYFMGQFEKYEADKAAALQALVEGTTADDLKAYAEQIAAARAERLAKIEAVRQQVESPQTLEDFRMYMRVKIGQGMSEADARLALSPEQRRTYDDLAAAASREARKNRADTQRTEVRATAQTTSGEVIETKHTQTGDPLFVVRAAERVERDVYDQWNAAAKRLGGRYSSYRGNGAIPGFTFKTREAADAFLTFLGGDTTQAQQIAKQRRDAFEDDRSQSAVERLTEMADRLEERADESLNASRKTNTARRANMAASAMAAAEQDKALARTMRNIAQSIQAGAAQFLDRVRQKAQVEMLSSIIRTAKYDELRAKYPSYADRESRRGELPTVETVDYTTWPTFTAYRSELARLGRELEAIDGAKKLGQRLLSVADDVTEAYQKFAKENFSKVSVFTTQDGTLPQFASREAAEAALRRSNFRGRAIVLPVKRGMNVIVMGPAMAAERGIWAGDGDARITLNADFAQELIDKAKQLNANRPVVTVPHQLGSAADRRAKFKALGIETAAEMRAALREFVGLMEGTRQPSRVQELERAMVGRQKDGLDFFPTSGAVIEQMIDVADLRPGMAALEPSAGMGHIADSLRSAGFDPDVAELSNSRAELLEAKGYSLVGRDFLEMSPRGFTYGDVFRHEDGRLGIMRGSGGLGSGRVGFQPVDASGAVQDGGIEWVDRDALTGVEKRGSSSGYDRIIMNPPFSDRRDAEHVQHAYTLLKPGGRIVAIMGEGVFFGQDKRAQDFRDWLDSLGGTSEKLPEGSFMDPALPVQTGVNARMVVIDKPESDVSTPSSAMPGVLRSGSALPETITVDGKSRPTRNSSGQFIHPTEEGIRNFWKWFGSSRVVDEQGRPLVVYRGGGEEFDEARVSQGLGTHFGTTAQANKVADRGAYGDVRDGGERTPSVIAAYLKIENPWVFDGDVDNWDYTEDLKYAISDSRYDGTFPLTDEQWAAGVRRHGTKDKTITWKDSRYISSSDQVRAILQDNGVDGIVYDNRKEGPGKSYIAFRPEQIKSATGNTGTFSPDSPSIVLRTADNAPQRVAFGRVDADAFLAGFVERYPSAPPITIVNTFDQLPASVQQEARNQGSRPESTKGVMVEGQNGPQIYLVSGNHASLADFEATVFHEVQGHAGVRALYGNDFVQDLNAVFLGIGGQGGLVKIMNARGMGAQAQEYIRGIQQAQATDRENARQAKAEGRPYTIRWTDAVAKAVLTEEVYAHIAEQMKDKPSLLDKFKTLIGQIRQWLRDHTFMELARLGETDLLFVLAKARKQLERPSGGPGGGRKVTVMQAGADVVTQDGGRLNRNDPDFTSAMRLADVLGLRVEAGPAVFSRGASTSPSPLPETLTIDGIKRPTRNSNGQFIHPTEEGIRNFWRWFGNSRVVDEDGRPRVVYHGTNADFASFNTDKLGRATGAASAERGFFFAGDPRTSNSYTELGIPMLGAELHDYVSPFVSKLREEYAEAEQDLLRRIGAFNAQSERLIANFVESYDGPLNKDGGIPGRALNKAKSELYDSSTRQARDRLRLLDKRIAEATEEALKSAKTFQARILPVYLKVDNPYIKDHKGASYRDETYNSTLSKAAEMGADGVFLENTYDGGPLDTIYVAFSADQIKSATGNAGTFSPDSPLIVFRTAGDFAAAPEGRSAIRDRIGDLFGGSARTFNRWWHKTVGTQYHKAKISPEFRRVYDRAHAFVDDVSRFALKASKKAGSILPHLDTWRDIGAGLNVRKQWADSKDFQAIAAPIFEGTLANGTTGTVWTDQELRDRFGLNEKQAGLYREFRDAVDASLETLAASEMARAARAAKMDVADVEMGLREAEDFYTAQAQRMVDAARSDLDRLKEQHRAEADEFVSLFAEQMKAGQKRKAVEAMVSRQAQEIAQADAAITDAEKLRDSFTQKGDQIRRLQAEGYAPLMRFGQYTVDVVRLDENGQPVTTDDGEQDRPFFGMFETEAAARQAERIMREEYPEYTVTRGVLSEQSNQLFKGVTPETAELFASMLGVSQSEGFQAYLKQAVANRSAMKRLIQRKGMDGFAQDVPRVLASFITSNARLASGNWHFGEMVKAANDIPKDKGDVKDEAVKLIDYIQNPQEEAAKMRGFLFFSFLGGSVAAALVNTTQTLTTTLPYLSQFGAQRAATAIARATKAAGSAVFGGLDKVKDAGMREAMKRASDEGIIDPQEIHMLMAEAGGNGASNIVGATAGLLNKSWAAPVDRVTRAATQGWGSLFGVAEKYNRHVAFMAAWEVAGGMTAEQLRQAGAESRYDFAKNAVTETQFDYSKVARPNWARGAVGATLFTFKTFTVNYLEFLSRLPSRERAIAFATLLLLSGLSGAPGADDLDDIIDTIGQKLGYNWNNTAGRHAWLMQTLGEGGANFVEHGISSLLPLDVSSRLGAGNLIPGTAAFMKSNPNPGRDVAEVFGPAGSVVAGAREVFDNLNTGKGVYETARPVLPKALNDIYQAVDIWQTGQYRDRRGRKVVEADKLDAILKGIGFQPNQVAEPRRVEWMLNQSAQMHRAMRADIYELWARGVFEKDREKVDAAQSMLREWNQKNPETPIRANPQSISERVKAMNRTSAERLVKATPREMRGALAAELAVTY